MNQKNHWKHIAMPKENKETQMKRIRWIVFSNREQVIIGKKKRKINEKKARILHYKEQGEHQELKECEGCDLNEYSKEKTCQFDKEIAETWCPAVKKVKVEEKGKIQYIRIRTQEAKEELLSRETIENKKKRKRVEECEDKKIYTDAVWDKRRKKGTGVWKYFENGKEINKGIWEI